MTQREALLHLPPPTEPPRAVECSEVLFQELIVAREAGLAIGSTLRVLPKDHMRTEMRRLFTGRLTEKGLAAVEEASGV